MKKNSRIQHYICMLWNYFWMWILLLIVVLFSQVGPLRCWPGGLCLSRSIGDTDVGEFIVPIPHVKQVKVKSSLWMIGSNRRNLALPNMYLLTCGFLSVIVASQYWWKTNTCFRWNMGRSVLRGCCSVVSGIACRTGCKACR
jgi:hypothetical protein